MNEYKQKRKEYRAALDAENEAKAKTRSAKTGMEAAWLRKQGFELGKTVVRGRRGMKGVVIWADWVESHKLYSLVVQRILRDGSLVSLNSFWWPDDYTVTDEIWEGPA